MDEYFDCEDPSRSTFSIAKDEVNDHYHFSGVTDRYWIQPAAIQKPESGKNGKLLRLVESGEEREIAHEFSRYFQRETDFDFALFDKHETTLPNDKTYLIRAPGINNGTYDFMVGAVGITENVDGSTVLVWIWLHPFFRGKRNGDLALKAWKELEELFGELAVLIPIQKPMQGFLNKNGIKPREATGFLS